MTEKKILKTKTIWELRKKPYLGHIKNNGKKRK